MVTSAPVPRVALYGLGKVALRDGLAAQGYERGTTVVLPALIPDGVVGAVRSLDLEPRFYDVGADLTPSMADVETAVDGGAAALVAVHYFGAPQPRFDALSDVAGSNAVDLVSDNAHGPLSRAGAGGRLLGTRGAFGITSLRKLLPIPDGAALYLNRGRAYDRARSAHAGVADGYWTAEAVFLAESLAMGVRDRHPTASDALRRLWSRGVTGPPRTKLTTGANGTNRRNGADRRNREHGADDPIRGSGSTARRDPESTYRAATRPMSRLSVRVCASTDPEAVVSGRRATFRTWVDHLAELPGGDPVYSPLPAGACPQACPVVAETGERATEKTDAVHGTHTWPPLPPDVVDSPAHPSAVDVASRRVPLPCHRTVDEPAIRRAVGRLR